MKKLLLILLLPLSVYSQSKQSTIDSCVNIMYKLVNDHRVANGESILTLSDSLTELAQSRAEYMYKTGEYNHIDSVHNENIAKGGDVDLYFKLSKGVYSNFNCWKTSSIGHNENMLNDWHTKAGYGFYKGYAVQLFDW
jgi:uncharacterized protein YkwD